MQTNIWCAALRKMANKEMENMVDSSPTLLSVLIIHKKAFLLLARPQANSRIFVVLEQ
jgi:hypothetical protein